MPDVHLAEKLHAFSRHALTTAGSSMGRHYGEHTALGGSLAAQAAHFTLIGFAALNFPLEGEIDEDAQSLTALARGLSHNEVRKFEVHEIEALALLDTIHTRPISRVLLPDSVINDMFYAFRVVEVLNQELRERIQEAKAGRQ